MTLDIIKKATYAMIKRKQASSYQLPAKVEQKIMSRHYSASEINNDYTQARSLS